ncbi:MAG: hypothetical protein QM703_23975 [Gemmatales bacterium]
MHAEDRYRTLLKKSLVALLIGAALVTLCYIFVDRPVAFYVHDHRLNSEILFKWLTYPEPVMQSWVPVVLVLLMVRGALGRSDDGNGFSSQQGWAW